MKLINLNIFKMPGILRGIIPFLVIVFAWTFILFSIGISKAKTEANNYINNNRDALEAAILQGNIVYVHSILRGLRDYGVESSSLETSVFSINQHRIINSGRIDRTIFYQESTLSIKNNGLYLGKVTYQISLTLIFINVFFDDYPLLIIILLSHLLTFLVLNYIFVSEVRSLQTSILSSVRNGNIFKKTNPGLIRRLIFSKEHESVVRRIATELADLGQIEAEKSRLATEHSIARQVAHDIRSPLSSINLILGKISGPEEVINILRFSVDRLSVIASDLLKKSKKDSLERASLSDIVINFNKYSIFNVVYSFHQLTDEIRVRYPEHSIFFESKYVGPDVFIKIDLGNLLRIGSILLNNSVESFSNNHSFAKLVMKFEKDILTISVEDNGSGMSAELVNRIGEPKVSFSKHNGNGLGLYYSTRVVQLMGGTLNVTSIQKAGTNITLHIPTNSADTKQILQN